MKKILQILLIAFCLLFIAHSSYGQAISATCAGAASITVNSVTPTATVGAAAGSPALTGCGAPAITNEGWFAFTATSVYSVVTFSNLGTQTAYVYIYTGVCGGLGEMTCMSIAAANINLVNFNTVVAQKYYVRIIKSGAAALTGRVGVYSNTGTNAVLCTPDKIAYSTGTFKSNSTKTDNNLIAGYTSIYNVGYSKFNTASVIPSNITIKDIALGITCLNNSLTTTFFGDELVYFVKLTTQTLNPVSATAASMYQQWTWPANAVYGPDLGPSFNVGSTYVYPLNAFAVSDFTAYYAQGWWTVCNPVDWATGYLSNNYVTWYGWNSQYTPYIVVTYTPNGCLPITVTAQPASPSSLCTPASASFSVAVDGTPAFTYQWQYNNAGSWTNISDGGTSPVYTGTSTSTLQLSNATANFEYRCITTNCAGANSVTSASGTLTVCESGTPTQTMLKLDR